MAPSPGTFGIERGYIVPIGGAEDKWNDPVILDRFAELCGGRQARLVVIPTASRQSDTSARYVRIFRELGVPEVDVLPIEDRRDGERTDYLEALERATGIFLTGGNQLRLSTIMGGTSVAQAIRRLNADGVHVACPKRPPFTPRTDPTAPVWRSTGRSPETWCCCSPTAGARRCWRCSVPAPETPKSSGCDGSIRQRTLGAPFFTDPVSPVSVFLRYLWALPTSLPGLVLAGLALATHGRVSVVDGVLEVCGGAATWLLARCVPVRGGARAMTLGHVVLGRSPVCLEATRSHERVHVRQAERWGPFFLPAYLLASGWAFVRGGDPYHDNPFEREAFATACVLEPYE